MPLERTAIEEATGLACSKVHTALCTRQADRVAEVLADATEPVIVCCAQEADIFGEIAADIGAEPPLAVDIRDRAGWSDEGAVATSKIAALLAEARLPRRPEKTIDIASGGLCLILGRAATALPVAERLADQLSVTCLLSDLPQAIPAPIRRFDVAMGELRSANGALGRFSVQVDKFRSAFPGGRGFLQFEEPRDGGSSDCDIILDLTGEAPLFPADHKRDGYLRADPGDPLAVERAASDAAQLVGTFEKTLHVTFEESLCAHSRAGQIGCTRCLDVCPTGAILPAGDVVEIDPHICAGCGSCSSVCPSGAVSFDAPPTTEIFDRLRVLARTYQEAGGDLPRLLVHDNEFGREMIALAARFGSGLPANVIPLEVPSLCLFGHAEMMVALASGFADIQVLLSPLTERHVLQAQQELFDALTEGLGIDGSRCALLDLADPDELPNALYGTNPTPVDCDPILPLGRRRDATRLAAKALAGARTPPPVPLPAGAPYGAVLVDEAACTLCLSCAGLCPSGALLDNPDKPQLLFREDACLQCGLCATICPEDAITLEPRLDISDAAFSQRVMKEEEPYPCIECGKLFGVRSTIERIVAKLEGQHSMFINSDNARLIRMCDDCRIKAQYHGDAAPFRMGERPRVRTTDDYLKERDDG